jgi:hypothetical protein
MNRRIFLPSTGAGACGGVVLQLASVRPRMRASAIAKATADTEAPHYLNAREAA